MFNNFRDKDDTQKLFSNALRSLLSKDTCRGFEDKNNGIAVITSDTELLKTLSDRLISIANNSYTIKLKTPKMELLSYEKLLRNMDQYLSELYQNAIYFEQGKRYAPDRTTEIPSEKTLVLTSKPDDLKFFLNAIFEKHFKDCGIELYPNQWNPYPESDLDRILKTPENPFVTPLSTKIVVNNENAKIIGGGDYYTRLRFRDAIDDIKYAIDQALDKNTPDNIM